MATKLINVPAEIRKYWWEKSENLINVPGTTISDSRVLAVDLKTAWHHFKHLLGCLEKCQFTT